MAAVKRDLSDFTKFPGEITRRAWYEFPTLVKKDARGKKRQWSIFVRLIKAGSKQMRYEVNWDRMIEHEVPILPEYLVDAELPVGTIAQYWTEGGLSDGKITVHPPTFPAPKCVGRSNERNVLKQALVEARSDYNKRLDSGYHTVEDDEKGVVSTRYYPMLASKFEDYAKMITYPALVQRKLDGNRVVAHLDDGGVEFYSRNLKEFKDMNDLGDMLLPALKKMPMYLDGEFYVHGKSLQEISGEARRESRKTRNNQFHIFDMFVPNRLEMPLSRRLELLSEFFKLLPDEAKDRIILVETVKVLDEKDLRARAEQFVTDGYEGAMVKNSESKYLTTNLSSNIDLRSREILKLKPLFTDEFEVVDFDQGTAGREVGAILWIVRVGRHTLRLQPKGVTIDERCALYKDALDNFDRKYRGRMMTVEYAAMSDSGIPLRAKACGFRDE